MGDGLFSGTFERTHEDSDNRLPAELRIAVDGYDVSAQLLGTLTSGPPSGIVSGPRSGSKAVIASGWSEL